ncbi:GxxExxY protein [Patescibacteria group bacterium]|nr:GxxExxY protein [Patescibacteria group bacterium]MBU4512434.1 GxxExxY protein [Patescibacteria group bacterium]MCG2692727.1 GxxExxY protein [Candidatus Parcubacteria bacterium]
MKNANNKANKVIHKDLSYKIVGILFEVYNDLGYGYQEKYYERAIVKYLIAAKIKFKRQVSYLIKAKGEVIGRYYLDFLIEDKIILELKKGNYFSKRNIEQVKGYLKATGMKLAILANFTSSGVKFFRVLNPDNLTTPQINSPQINK